MKKLLFFLAAILMSVTAVTVLSSCGDDEPDGNSIVGTWEGHGTTVTFGSDGSYRSEAIMNQYRIGTYSYNKSQQILVVNIKAVAGSNGAYTSTYLVQTLNSTNLVLLDIENGDTWYYTRK